MDQHLLSLGHHRGQETTIRVCPPQPVWHPLWMRVRKAWHTVGRRSGRSLMAMPRVRASPLKAPSTSVGWVQKPGSRVQTWKAQRDLGGQHLLPKSPLPNLAPWEHHSRALWHSS